jgi:hypothetical protein
MLTYLSSIGTLLLPQAHAATLEQIGTDGPGITEMWAEILSIFPHTGYGSGGFAYVVELVAAIILRFIGGVAVLVIIYAGIRMMMTVGEEGAFEEAKKTLLYAVIGLFLVMGTDVIMQYVLSLTQQAVGG